MGHHQASTGRKAPTLPSVAPAVPSPSPEAFAVTGSHHRVDPAERRARGSAALRL